MYTNYWIGFKIYHQYLSIKPSLCITLKVLGVFWHKNLLSDSAFVFSNPWLFNAQRCHTQNSVS